MKEPLGDNLLWIVITIFCSVIIFGWLILLVTIFLQWLFPKFEDRIEMFLQLISNPLGIIQKYSIWGALILFLIRLFAGWLGWAEPLSGTSDE